MKKTLLFLLLCLLPALSVAEVLDIAYPSRGIQIPATLAVPDDTVPFPVVVMIHGHGGSRNEHRGFSAIADMLLEAGIGSIRMDLPGCGESSEPFAANSLSAIKADVRAAIAYVRKNFDPSAIGLFGYSMGGRAALELLAEGEDIAACALLAPANDTQDLIETAFPDFDALHEIARSEGSARQYFSGGNYDELGLAWFEDLRRYDDPALEAALAYSGPSLVIWAQDDQVVRPHVSRHTADLLRADTFDATGKGHIYGFWLENDPLRESISSAVSTFFSTHLFP